MGADQDTVTVLQDHIIRDKLAIDLHSELVNVFIVRNHSSLSLVTIKVETALPVGNTDALDSNLRLKLRGLLANEIIAFIHGELHHSRHLRVLINITQLRCSLQLLILALPRHRFTILCCKFLFKLRLLFSKGLFLLSLHLLQLLVDHSIASCSSSVPT